MKPIYDFAYVTYATGAVPADLTGSTYWYDTEVEQNGETVYQDTSDAYASWYDGSEWFTTVVADIATVPTDYYQEGATPNLLEGNGAFAGTLTMNENTIADAWYRAETTAFESLADFVGSSVGVECYRGFLPVQGDSDDDLYVNVWQMTSGNSGQFDMDRLYGANPNWCSLRSDARIESTWETREKAMKFAGAVTAWLKATNNLNEVGNVSWCTLSDIPDEPEIYRTTGTKNRQRYWRQTINLELVYRTESNY